MTNEKAIHTLRHYDLSAAGDLHEAIDIAIAAIRSHTPSAEAMREAAAKVLDDERIHVTVIDHEDESYCEGLSNLAAAIRALPLPAPGVPEAVRRWAEMYHDYSVVQGKKAFTVPDAILRDWIRKEYGI